jgi:hypothetical protein
VVLLRRGGLNDFLVVRHQRAAGDGDVHCFSVFSCLFVRFARPVDFFICFREVAVCIYDIGFAL